jgi:acetyl-CoA carboxylase carboxyl transferase subunit alpha
VAMLQYAWYSVISPEGCAAILWKTSNDQTNRTAATALALTAEDNLRNGLVDDVVAEPVGAAHRNPRQTADNVLNWITEQLQDLKRFKPQTLVQRRYEKLRRIGALTDRRQTTRSKPRVH